MWKVVALFSREVKTLLICLHRRLLTQLESFQPPPEEKGKEAKGDATDHILYQLYYRPEQAQFSKNSRVSFYT